MSNKTKKAANEFSISFMQNQFYPSVVTIFLMPCKHWSSISFRKCISRLSIEHHQGKLKSIPEVKVSELLGFMLTQGCLPL